METLEQMYEAVIDDVIDLEDATQDAAIRLGINSPVVRALWEITESRREQACNILRRMPTDVVDPLFE